MVWLASLGSIGEALCQSGSGLLIAYRTAGLQWLPSLRWAGFSYAGKPHSFPPRTSFSGVTSGHAGQGLRQWRTTKFSERRPLGILLELL